MFVIGLTGGIGAGKSTVAKLFSELNVPIIDTDVIAKNITDTNVIIKQTIDKQFPTKKLLVNDQLDRAKLRNIIFNDPHQKQWLEELLHPLIRQTLQMDIQKHKQAPYILVIIPLLFDAKAFPFLNRILVVDAPVDLQVERIMRRDNIAHDLAHKMIASQIQREERLQLANDIIINDGVFSDLMHQVHALHQKYLQISQQD